MSEHSDQYVKALAGFDTVIRQVPAGKWESQSPCEQWKAIEVAGHVIGVQQYVRSALTGVPLDGSPTHRETAGDDPVGRWEQARAALLESMTDENLAKVIATPFGEMPADAFLGILVTDAISHTWDLAQAAGIDVQLDPDLVAAVTERMAPLDAAIRRPGFFGPKVEAPEGADAQTRLMAFLGRSAVTV